jgi:hypothetical protein
MNQLVGGQVLVKEMVSWERLCHQAERKVPMPLQLDRAPIAVFLEQQLVLTKSNSMKCIKQKLNGPEALSFTTSTPMGTSYLFYMQWPFAVKLDQELALPDRQGSPGGPRRDSPEKTKRDWPGIFTNQSVIHPLQMGLWAQFPAWQPDR